MDLTWEEDIEDPNMAPVIARRPAKRSRPKPTTTQQNGKRRRGALTTGSCCTGLATDEMALESLGVRTKPLFMCELNLVVAVHVDHTCVCCALYQN